MRYLIGIPPCSFQLGLSGSRELRCNLCAIEKADVYRAVWEMEVHEMGQITSEMHEMGHGITEEALDSDSSGIVYLSATTHFKGV